MNLRAKLAAIKGEPEVVKEKPVQLSLMCGEEEDDPFRDMVIPRVSITDPTPTLKGLPVSTKRFIGKPPKGIKTIHFHASVKLSDGKYGSYEAGFGVDIDVEDESRIDQIVNEAKAYVIASCQNAVTDVNIPF